MLEKIKMTVAEYAACQHLSAKVCPVVARLLKTTPFIDSSSGQDNGISLLTYLHADDKLGFIADNLRTFRHIDYDLTDMIIDYVNDLEFDKLKYITPNYLALSNSSQYSQGRSFLMSPRHFSAFYQAMLIYIGLAKYHADYHSVINVIYRENGGSVIDNFLALGFAEIMLTSKLRVREAVFANIPENDQALYLYSKLFAIIDFINRDDPTHRRLKDFVTAFGHECKRYLSPSPV